MHAAAWGDHPIAHYGRWLKEHHPEHLHSFAGLLQAEPGGDTAAPETKNNPIPREWYHTDWVADLTVDWLGSLGGDEPWFCWMSFPDPHHPWDPPASELHRVPWQDLDLPPGHPGSDEAIREVLARKPAHWLGFWEGSFPNMEGGPASFVPSRLTHDQIREINAKVHVMNELIDEACGRVLADGRAAGLAGRHRRDLHHRPRRAAGRLRPPLQGSVPHRRADAAALRLAAGAVRRRRAGGGDATRWARSIWRRRSAPSPASSRRPGCRAGPCRWPTASPGASARCASGTASSPATACTCGPSTATGGSAPSTSRRRRGSPTGSRRCGATACCARAPSSTRRPRPAPAGWASPPGELYNVDDDPYQFENLWDDPTPAALRDDLVARPLRQPARRGAAPQGDGAGLTAGAEAPGVARSMAGHPLERSRRACSAACPPRSPKSRLARSR